jgi:hypothetical protein
MRSYLTEFHDHYVWWLDMFVVKRLKAAIDVAVPLAGTRMGQKDP